MRGRADDADANPISTVDGVLVFEPELTDSFELDCTGWDTLRLSPMAALGTELTWIVENKMLLD